MTVRIVAGLVAIGLLFAYLAPMAFKMKDLPLAIVILVGVVLMLVDMWHSLRESDD